MVKTSKTEIPSGTPRGKRNRLLTAKEAAEYLGLSEQTIRQWASQRKIPSVKIGRALRFLVDDLDQLINEGRTPQKSE